MAKLFATKAASIRTLICVAPHVHIQCVRSSECSTANFARMRSDVIMVFAVIFHLWFGFESALKRRSIKILAIVKWEKYLRFITNFASESSFSHVCAFQMSFKITF